MGWITRLLGAIGGQKRNESDVPDSYEDTVKIEVREINPDRSLAAEVHEWLDETENLKEDLDPEEPAPHAEDDFTTTVPTLKETDLPNLKEFDDETSK